MYLPLGQRIRVVIVVVGGTLSSSTTGGQQLRRARLGASLCGHRTRALLVPRARFGAGRHLEALALRSHRPQLRRTRPELCPLLLAVVAVATALLAATVRSSCQARLGAPLRGCRSLLRFGELAMPALSLGLELKTLLLQT
jgi:hypothetical protein